MRPFFFVILLLLLTACSENTGTMSDDGPPSLVDTSSGGLPNDDSESEEPATADTATACNDTETSTDADTDADTDTDADADTDTDSDTDADSDTNTDSDTGTAKCPVVSGDYGDCEMALGFAFDGEKCAMFSGCGCKPDCDSFFESAEACAETCAAAGECNSEMLINYADAPIAVDMMCDEVFACLDDGWQDAYALLPDGSSCNSSGGICDSADMACNTVFPLEGYHITSFDWSDLCAATLLPGINKLICMVNF